MPLQTEGFQDVVGIAQTTLDQLNQQFGTSVAMKVVSVSDLHNWGLNPRYAGFVIQESPAVIYIVPQNIQIPEEAVKTVRHEFKHVLDLTGACPFCTAPMRELRALEFEASPVAARPSAESIQINQAVESLVHVIPQVRELPLDLAVPEECEPFLDFIRNSIDLIMENSRILGRLERIQTEAEQLGPPTATALRETISSTKFDIQRERDAVLREAVRLSKCLARLEVERVEDRMRELMRPLGRVSGQAVAINEAIEETVVVDDARYKLKLQAVIGELVAAQSHLAHLDPDISAKIRSLKKRLQIAIWGRPA